MFDRDSGCHVTSLYDVAIIGGGPSGSYAGSLLAEAGYRVLVLERRHADAVAPSCTGVVGLPYVELVGVARDVILAEASSAALISPSGARLHVASPHVQAYVLDRALLERRLRRRAVLAGAHLREGSVVSRIERRGSEFEVIGSCGGAAQRYSCRALILAAGVSPGLSRRLGIAAPRRYMVGAHAEVDMDGVPETEVYLLPHLSPGAFAWLVPIGGRRVRVGVLCTRSAGQLTRRFLDMPEVRARLVRAPAEILRRPVPVSACPKTYAPGLVVVGDAAGQVKPTTGGGLYFGACAAQAAADVVGRALASDDVSENALSAYQHHWQSAFGRELRRGALTRGIYSRLSASQVNRVIEYAERTGVARELVDWKSFSFDRHGGTLLTGLLRCLPGFAFGRGAPTRETQE